MVMSRVNQICCGLDLSQADLKRVRDNFYVEDLAITGARLAHVEQRSIVVPTGLADEVVKKYRDVGLALVTLDPTSLVGPGESSGNDGMAELMRIGRRLAKDLLACVLLVHHVAQIVARTDIQDQYAGRGGTAFADNSRFNCQLVTLTRRDVNLRGSTYILPSEVTDAILAGESVLALLIHKLSYQKNDGPPIVLVRTGFKFQHVKVQRLENTPEARAERDRDRLDKLVVFIETKLDAGIKFSKDRLTKMCTGELGMSRDDLRSLVDTALGQDRLELAPLPAHERHGGRKEYLRPVNAESA